MAERRVMILEDEPIIAWDIETELQSRGIAVAGVASQVADALAILETGEVSVAILDIHIGSETSYQVASVCLDRQIAVIFLTGNDGEERPEELLGLDIVAKPVDFELLVAKLQQLGIPADPAALR